MNSWTKWLIIAIVATTCIGQKQRSKKKGKGNDLYRYITNWSEYGIPKKIEVETLKNILLKVAAYKRANYCPLGPTYDDCRNEKLKSIISSIVHETVSKDKSVVDLKTGLSLRNNRKDHDFYDSVYLILLNRARYNRKKVLKSKFKRVKCHCHKKKHEPQKLAISRYKFIKVNPDFQKDPSYNRNKPFGKIITAY